MKKKLKMIYLFSILGLQMIGNIASMLPILEYQLVTKRNLLSKEEVLDAIAIGRCGPGAAVINTIVLIGNYIDGFIGGVIAAVSFIIFPSIIIITISSIIDKFLNNPIVISAFKAIITSLVVMIINTVTDLAKKTLVNKITIIVFCIALLVMLFTPISSIICIIITLIIGIIFIK